MQHLVPGTRSLMCLMLLVSACTTGAQARLAYGGMPAELQRLHDEGWLEAFRAGECQPLYPDEQVDAEPASLSADEVAADEAREATLRAEFAETSHGTAVLTLESSDPVIHELASTEQFSPNRRTTACMLAAERLRSVQQEYRAAEGDELAEANAAIAELAPRLENAVDLCPNTDDTLFGAELAVARYLNATQTNHSAPFGYAERDCSLPTLAGLLPVRVEASEEETGPGGYDYFALDGVIQRCTYGVEGHADGCTREQRSLNCGASCEPGQDACCSRPYEEFLSRDEGTVTILIGLSRAAMGCGSMGLRAYYVRRDGRSWRIVRELVIGMGNHGV